MKGMECTGSQMEEQVFGMCIIKVILLHNAM